MEEKSKKNLSQYMRQLHRDIGFLIIGFVVVNALSGMLLTYRNTDLLKHDVITERKLDVGLEASALGNVLRIRDLKVIKEEGDLITFQAGTYNRATGIAEVTTKEVIFPLNKFINYHKAMSDNPKHWSNVVFGALLFFMAVSSFWMYKPGTRVFRRVMFIMSLGVAATLILLFIR
jgi:hypothetical protein